MKSKLANRAALGLALVAAMAVAATARADDQGGALPANPAPFAQVNPGAMNQDELLACANTQIDVDARMSEVESRRQALEARQARFDEEVSLLADDVARFNADRKRSKERAEELKRRGAAHRVALAGINREVDELNRYVKQANELGRAHRQNCAFRSFRLDDAARLSPQQRAAMGVEDIAALQQQRRSWDAGADCSNFEKDYSAAVVDAFNAMGSRAAFASNASCTVSLTVTVDPGGKLLSAQIHHLPSDCPEEVLAFAQRRVELLRCTNASGKQRIEAVDLQIQESTRLPIWR